MIALDMEGYLKIFEEGEKDWLMTIVTLQWAVEVWPSCNSKSPEKELANSNFRIL